MKKHNMLCRFLCTLLVLAVLTAVAGVPAFAAGAVLTIGTDIMAAPGETVEVPVIVSGMSGLAVAQFALTYDPEILEYVGYTQGNLINNKGYLMVNDETMGEFYFAWSRSSGLTASEGTLITLHFRVNETGAASLRVDENEDFVFASVVSGSTYNEFEPTREYGTIAAPDFFLPSALTRIDSQAFTGTGASVLYIPENVTSISADAFDSSVLLVYKASSSAAAAAQGLTNPSVVIP
ncbi:MAG: hypothetical protein II885_03825 [Oscillospiraceae bacterium]|nr:hypothetical protein [Oscillospiraceae bacterium]